MTMGMGGGIGKLSNTIKCTNARIRFKRVRNYAFKESGARKALKAKDWIRCNKAGRIGR